MIYLCIGPNVYNIPSVLGGTTESNIKTAPAFSMSSRQKVFTDFRVLVPGPGSYESIKPDAVRSKSPAYTMSARYQIPNDHSQIPGPGAHCPEKVSEFFILSFRFLIIAKSARCISGF